MEIHQDMELGEDLGTQNVESNLILFQSTSVQSSTYKKQIKLGQSVGQQSDIEMNVQEDQYGKQSFWESSVHESTQKEKKEEEIQKEQKKEHIKVEIASNCGKIRPPDQNNQRQFFDQSLSQSFMKTSAYQEFCRDYPCEETPPQQTGSETIAIRENWQESQSEPFSKSYSQN